MGTLNDDVHIHDTFVPLEGDLLNSVFRAK